MRSIIMFSLAVLFVACQSSETVESKTINISGLITNATGDSLAIFKDDQIEKFAIAEDGSFSGSFEGDNAYYTLSYNRENTSVYLSPGDEVNITLDTKQFDESLTYTGTGSENNNYLAKKFLLMEEQQKDPDMRSLYSMDETDFNEVMQEQKGAVNQHLMDTELDAEFKAIEKANIKYEFLSMFSRFEAYHKYFAQDQEFEVSEDFKKVYTDIDYTNEADFVNVPNYKQMVMNYYSGDLGESLDKLATVESGVIKAACIKNLTNWLSPGTEELKAKVDQMKSLTDDTELIAELDEKFSSMEALLKGNASPGFEFKNVSGDMVNLNDLKGKSVYIDVWATWCGPCKQEIPHLKALEKEYHDKNIEFVSISVDVPEDEDKWKKMIDDKELKGVQVISDNGWETDFVEDYLIRGIPRFILLDEEGKIVSADAPRPSSDATIKGMIDEVL